MVNFGNLEKLTVAPDVTAEFPFYGIAGEPTLIVRPATQANKEFFNSALKQDKSAKRRARAAKKTVVTLESIRKARIADVKLFRSCIVTGWYNVFDIDGNEVGFSEDNCDQFLMAIPDDMFTDLREFCLDINNFRDLEEMDPEELEDLSGN